MFTTARGKRHFCWKASTTENLHRHLMEGYVGDVSRMAVAQEWKATSMMTFLSEKESRSIKMWLIYTSRYVFTINTHNKVAMPSIIIRIRLILPMHSTEVLEV